MTTQSSHTRSANNGNSPSESSSISNTSPDDGVESESFLNATSADALHSWPNTEENTHACNEEPQNLSRDSSLSYDRISDVMGVVPDAGIIHYSDTSDDLRTVQSRPIDHSRDSENGSDREEHHTISPNHSIRTPLSEPDVIHQDASSTSVEARRPWTPFFLQAETILGFIASYVLLLLALIILAILDARNQGLATVDSNLRYFWTYGPTAVLATLAGLWGQVEHRMKQLMPWAILHNGPTPAASTLLLNYIEPAQPVSLYTSIKNGHYPVTLAIVGSLLIQLLTVISTGLLMPQVERTHHRGVPIQTTEVFRFDSTHLSIGSSPVLSAIALNSGNLSYPLGTSDRLAFSTLHVEETIAGVNSSIETTTDAFHAEVDCEPVTDFSWDDACMHNKFQYGDCQWANAIVTFATPSCHVENLTMGTIIGSQRTGIFGGTKATKCDSSSSAQRLVVALTNYMIGLEYDESGELQTNQKLTMDNTSLLSCQPRYSIEPWSLTVNDTGTLANEGSKSFLGPTNSTGLPLSQWDFMEAFLQSVTNAESAASGPADLVGGIIDADEYQPPQLDPFFDSLAAFSNPPNIADFLDTNILLNETTRFFSMASAQLARSYFMTPSNKVISGTVSVDEQRLRIRGLSLYLMISTLVALIADAVVLCFIRPRNTVSRDPGSVGGLAVMVSESPSCCDVLSDKSLWSKYRLHSYLSHYQSKSVLEPSSSSPEFRVVLVHPGLVISASEKDNDQHSVRWWQPISTRLWAKAAITAFLLLLVASMESSYQSSKKHNGLANVDTESYVRYTWAYVPAVAMMAAQLLVGMTGDSSRIIFPYHELRRKLIYTTENLFDDPLSRVMIHAVYSSIRLKQYALLATGLSMLLTPFLTIVSSGLFTPELTKRTYDSIFRIENVLNTSIDLPSTIQETSLGYQSSFILNLILTSNLSYPSWTYSDLTFHEMTIDTIKDTDKELNNLIPDPTGLTLHATIPAVRATLDCTYFAPEHVHISYTEDTRYNTDTEEIVPHTYITIHTDPAAQLSLPEECRNKTVDWDLTGNFSSYGSQPFAWFGSGRGRSSMDCSNLLTAFGSSLRNGSAQTMACVPVVEQVQTDTTFSLPSHRIVAATTNDATAEPIANMTAAIDLNLYLPGGPFSSDTSGTDGGSYDNTFRILLAAPGVATLEAADFDAANAAHPKIAAALQHLFGLTYAQVLNLNARSDVPANASTVASGNISMPTRLEGQIVDPRSQMRLKQSAVSTRILEGLLGAIVVCLLVSFWLLDTRKVMPENACSIAVAASLIAGADMLRDVPSGAEWWNDDEAVKKEVFGKDAVFSLGWWGAEERETETGDRDRDSEAVVERDGSGEGQGLRRRRFGIDRGRASWD